jgi:hypothetical protein
MYDPSYLILLHMIVHNRLWIFPYGPHFCVFAAFGSVRDHMTHHWLELGKIGMPNMDLRMIIQMILQKIR